MAAPGAKQKVLIVLLSIVLVVVGAAGFGIYQITRPIDPGWVDKVNDTSLAEANRKLKLVTDAKKVSKRGFVNLSEAEINAYLRDYTKTTLKAASKTNTPGTVLQKSLLELSFDGVTWDVALEKPIYGHPVEFVWQRTYSLEVSQSGIEFPMTEMRVGKVAVPKKYWDQVQKAFGKVDDMYTNQFQMATHFPWMAITTNDSKHPQITLYSYAVTPGK